MRPRFTAAARCDLEEIVRYVGTRDSSAAIRLIDRLETQCWQLARNPSIGQARADLIPGIRFFPVGNYLIFYRKDTEGIEVIRILHGARDYGVTDF
jgi:toxin ParE1/3/4